MSKRFFFPALLLGAAGSLFAGAVEYITVDTSSIFGTTGSIDFQFNPGPLATQAADLQIFGFATDGSLAGVPLLTGDVSGLLPGTLTFDNGTAYNDYFQGLTYGNSLSFEIGLYGPALTAPDDVFSSGSLFAFSMFSDSAGTVPVLTSDTVDGFAVTDAVNLDGTTTLTDYSAQASVNPTPEPSSVVLFGMGTALILASRLRRRGVRGSPLFAADPGPGRIRSRMALFLGLALILLNPNRSDAQTISPTNGLIGFWTGNHTANDSSLVGNNGSFGGRYVPGCPGGGGAAFNLATGYVYIPNNSVYDNFQHYPGWTVGFWFNANGTAGPYFFLGQDNGSGYQPKWFVDYGYTVYGSLPSFVWHVNDYNTERIFLSSSSVSPFPNGWNHLTVVTNNSPTSVAFYLNGVPIGGYVLGGSPGYVLETTAQLIFGEMEGFTYNGLMCDVAIYDRALSAQEVVHLVNSGSQIQTTASGLAYSRVTKTFDGTVTITNVSGNVISGPFQILFASLPSGVTIANASGTYNGSPYITVNGTLAAGQSASVSIQLSNPSDAAISATPVVYSGTFN